MDMALIDKLKSFKITPDRAFYHPGEVVRLIVSVEASKAMDLDLDVKIYRGLELIETINRTWNIGVGQNQLYLLWQPDRENPVGYGVDASLSESDGKSDAISCQTAFDVLIDWTVFPRYGFVSDFSPSRANVEETIETLNQFHLNGLQFYDWLYRHEMLIPPKAEFVDPLDRPLSLKIIKELINAAHKYGMKATPYLAVYAASIPFWKSHPDWVLYDQDHHPIPFGNEYLGIMNPVGGGEWSEHLLKECDYVLTQLPFDGLHIDQYGDPKSGYDANGLPVDIPSAFAAFINAAVQQNPDVPVVFNAVGNWPIETLAKTPVAFNYIEIWPPKTRYMDVAEIVRNARRLSGQKPVVIALYLHAINPINNLLADAMIFSAGGTRIELGENGRLLSDPYFPKHEAMDTSLSERLRRQLELIIRYEEWISPLIEESDLAPVKGPEGIEHFFRKTEKGYSLCQVNLGSLQPLHWNEEHPSPEAKRNFTLEIQLEEPIEHIWLVSPDHASLSPVPVEFESISNKVIIKVPSLEIWNVLFFEMKKTKR
ncbi:MAG: hypothetical protein GYA52_12580 [Chloroflexi bacterium]|nr:hypothetical protein [Chloroflexota bacterium]